MSTKVIKEGNVTTTIMDLTNGVGDKSAEVRVASSEPTETFKIFNELLAKSCPQSSPQS